MAIVPFRERLARDDFPITYEAISPRGADVQQDIDRFANLPCLTHLAAVNLTNNPSARVRIDPIAFGHLLMDQAPVDIIAHITCRDDTLAGIQRWLFGSWALGIKNVAVMTGDHPKEGDYPEERRVDSLNAIELIAGIRNYINQGSLIPDVMVTQTRYGNRLAPPPKPRSTKPLDFYVGAPIIPWRNNEEGYAKAKLEAGAQFLQTQITWDEKPVLDWIQRMEDKNLLRDTPVLVGTSPLKTLRTMEFMNNHIPMVRVPPDIQKRLKEAADPGPESVTICTQMFERLKDGAQTRGLKTKIGAHILPINDDNLGNQLVENVAKL